MKKVKSIKNGDLIKGSIYNRKFDFSRDTTNVLVNKLVRWSDDKELKKYVSEIKNKLNKRIERGTTTKAELNILTKKIIAKTIIKEINKIK